MLKLLLTMCLTLLALCLARPSVPAAARLAKLHTAQQMGGQMGGHATHPQARAMNAHAPTPTYRTGPHTRLVMPRRYAAVTTSHPFMAGITKSMRTDN